MIGAGVLCLGAWFFAGHGDDIASVDHGLLSTSPWSWLQALALSAALATSTGGVARHSLRMTGVSMSFPAATRLSSASMFLCAVIPSCGMAGAPLFASQAARQMAPASTGAAGYFIACITGRLGLELAVVLSLPLLASYGIPIPLVLAALAVHAISTIVKVTVVSASRRHETTLVRWAAAARSRLRRASEITPGSCPARQIVEHFAAVRWQNRDLRAGLAWSVVGKLVGGLMVIVAVRAVDGSISWTAGFTIYVAATIIGAASFIPAGLGATDLTIGHALVESGLAPAQAAAAVLFYRLFQLWLPLVAGGVLVTRLRSNANEHQATLSRPVDAGPGVMLAAVITPPAAAV